jgi:hypothetical protein
MVESKRDFQNTNILNNLILNEFLPSIGFQYQYFLQKA